MYKFVDKLNVCIDKSAQPIFDEFIKLHPPSTNVDESDLVILRLIGVKFNYSDVVFSPISESTESDVS